MTPWWRRRLALGVIHLVEALERAAVALYGLARRLAPREFRVAEQLHDDLQHELDDLIGPPLDYDPTERRSW